MTNSLILLLVKATAILVFAIGITVAMQRTSATARHLVWLVTLGGLLLVPALTAWSPLRLAVLPATSYDFSIARTAPSTNSATTERFKRDDSTISPPGGAIAASAAQAPIEDGGSRPNTATATVSRRALTGISLVVAVWSAGALAILMTLAWAGMSVRRIVRNARPLDSADWNAPLFEIADRIGLNEPPRLLQSSDAKMPFACGIMHPTIVLPAESESWTLDRRRAVLLHELAHVRRHDLLGHTLGRLACAVYWFHPLVWTAAKRLRSESERACDDLALACGTRATDYAEHLLDIVTSVRGDSTPLVALAMARRKEFEGRMLAILDPHLRRSTPSRRQSAALIAALALISLTVGAIAPVARPTNAAMVAATPQAQQVARSHAPPTGVAALPDVPTTAHTRVLPGSGDLVTSEDTADVPGKSTTLAPGTSMSNIISQSVNASNATLNLDSPMEVSVKALADAGVNIGLRAASKALASIVIDSKALQGRSGDKHTDDRAVLLSRVLTSDTSSSLRRIAAWGLQEYAYSHLASDALAGALRHDADWHVREMAAWALAEANHQAVATDALVDALKRDSELRVRITAAWALGQSDAHAAEDELTAALSDASVEIRQRAAWGLGNVSPKQAPKALVALLSDKDARTRRVAAWALYNIGDETAAPAIESALKREQDPDVQLAMIRSLAALGEQSVAALTSLLDSSDPRVKAMAVRALAGGRAIGAWPWPWPIPRPFP